MKMKILPIFLFTIILIMNGCGYTTASLLPKGMDSIYVANFKNAIDPAREVSSRRMDYSYRPGLENDITRAVINKFIFDGALEIETEQKANITLEGELTDFRQYPLSYSKDDEVEEFRMEIFVNLTLRNNKTGEIMWEEKNFMGQTSYAVTGPNTKSESGALQDAVDDLAKRIVERTIEAW